MNLDNYGINFDEEGTQLRLLAPMNKTSVAVHEMIGNPFGKSLFTIRSLASNPAYDYAGSSSASPAGNKGQSVRSGVTGGGGGDDEDTSTVVGGIKSSNNVTSSNNPIASSGLDFSFSGSSTKVDHISATPDCTIIAVASERILRLVSAESKQVVAEMWMEDKILNLKMNSEIIAVILAKATHFFFIETFQPLPELRTQWPNSNHNGLGALSCMLGINCYFAVSQSLSDKKLRGDVFLYNPKSAATLTVIDAHDEPVRCIEFSGNGNRFATVSNNGRKIRIWSCPECVPLFELLRGSSDAVVFSLALNFDASILALTSNSGTLHIFKPSVNNRSIGKISGKNTHSLCFLSPDGQFLYVLFPPDATSKTAKLERHSLSHDLKVIELDQEMNLTV